MYMPMCILPNFFFFQCCMKSMYPWRGRGLLSCLLSLGRILQLPGWTEHNGSTMAWLLGSIIQLLLGRICSPWEPSHQAVRKLSLAHVERPLKWAHVERNWGPQWIASSNGQTHEGASLQKIPVLAFELLSWGSDIYLSWKRQAIPTVPCPSSWPRESMNIINGIYTTELRPACHPGTKTV